MRNKPFRVLSIDFDFFQDTTQEIIQNYYPDGADLNTVLSEIVWVSKYISYQNFKGRETLKEVTINKHLFQQIQQIIQRQRTLTPCVIAQSHVHIYDQLIERIAETQKAEIYHIDFHHDYQNGNQEVDCGNWLGKFVEHHPETDVVWFTRENALQAYGSYPALERCIQFDLQSIMDQTFDLVFLCRSDAWLPPHLDVYFDDLVILCNDTFATCYVSDSILCPRDIESIYANADALSIWYQKTLQRKE